MDFEFNDDEVAKLFGYDSYEDMEKSFKEQERLEALKTPEQKAKEKEDRMQRCMEEWVKRREEREMREEKEDLYSKYYSENYEDEGVGEDEAMRDAINNRLDD